MKLSDIKPRENNPRKIGKAELEKLCESIRRDPEFMVLRPIVVDNDNVILGGNQRWQACKKLGMKEIPDMWVVKAENLTEEQRNRFIIVDNAPAGLSGEWDFEALISAEWLEAPLGNGVGLGELGLGIESSSFSLPDNPFNVFDGTPDDTQQVIIYAPETLIKDIYESVLELKVKYPGVIIKRGKA